MIFLQTLLAASDNSGVRLLKCFYIFGKKFNACATAGDIVLGSVRRCVFKRIKLRRGDKHRGVIVRTRKGVRRRDGIVVKFNVNSIVILGMQKDPLGTRVFGPIFRELRFLGYLKIVSLSSRAV